MSNISYTGAFSAATLNVPGVYLNVKPSGQGVIGPATFDLLGIVGVANWGPVGVATLLGSSGQLPLFGNLINRSSDLVTHATIALQVQQAAGIGSTLVLCRATDGTDAAASAVIQSNCLTLTSKYTGTRGNQTAWNIDRGSAANTYKLTLQLQGFVPEIYDNISQGVTAATVTAGTGATAVPALMFSAPNAAGGGVQASGNISLKVVGTPTPGTPGTGFLAGDHITLANGVVLQVATVSSGVIVTLHPITDAGSNAGSLSGAGTAVPTNPVPMVSTDSVSGGGSPTFNLAWGLGTVSNLFGGSGYNSATATLGAGAGSGSVAAAVGYWTNMANAVNQGNSPLRGASNICISTAGAGNTTPALASGILSGGQDGATGVTSAMLVGVDTAGARTGVYAFRNQGLSDCIIADLSDASQEPNLIAFGQSEGVEMHTSGPPGETPTAGATAKNSAGSDNPWLRRWLGDWTYWTDNLNGTLRLIAPATFGAAMMSTLQPQESGLNKQVVGVQSTQRSRSGNPYGNDELGTLVNAGIDVITNPIPRGFQFGCAVGLNASSDKGRNSDVWPRLTSFLARSLTGPGALGTLIGEDITPDFWRHGYDLLDSFLSGLVRFGTIEAYNIEFSPRNNPPSQTAQGLVVAEVLIRYLGIARIFLVNMQSGQTVVVPATNTAAIAA